MTERFQTVDKAQLARRFGAAARHYDAHARFQQEVGQALLEWMPDRLVGTDLTVSGLDLGCGTGFFLPQLANRCHQLVGLDLAPGMLAQAALRDSGARLLCGDAEQLPFADNTFDWVFSSLALQWCERPAQAFGELLRVVKPGGQIFSRPCSMSRSGSCEPPGSSLMVAPMSIASSACHNWSRRWRAPGYLLPSCVVSPGISPILNCRSCCAISRGLGPIRSMTIRGVPPRPV